MREVTYLVLLCAADSEVQRLVRSTAVGNDRHDASCFVSAVAPKSASKNCSPASLLDFAVAEALLDLERFRLVAEVESLELPAILRARQTVHYATKLQDKIFTESTSRTVLKG